MTDAQAVIARLAAALADVDDRGCAGAALLPSRIARAAATVLGVDGASLSLLGSDLRVPLGASSPAATVAERLQSTLGEGPCLAALYGGLPSRSDSMRLAQTWPMYHQELTASTPFRSVVTVPLPFSPDGGGGALDLYLVGTEDSTTVDLAECAVVADRLVELLVRAVSPTRTPARADNASTVGWLQSDDARTRMDVWVAIGMLTARLGVDAADALAVLRAWAHSHDSDLDRVAAQTVHGDLDPELLRP